MLLFLFTFDRPPLFPWMVSLSISPHLFRERVLPIAVCSFLFKYFFILIFSNNTTIVLLSSPLALHILRTQLFPATRGFSLCLFVSANVTNLFLQLLSQIKMFKTGLSLIKVKLD